MTADDTRFRAMKDRLDELVEENAWLKRELGMVQSGDRVTRLQRAYDLTENEARILLFLFDRRGSTVPHGAVMNALYSDSPDSEPQIKIISVYVCKLRKKLAERMGADAIATVWGVGYALTAHGIDGVAKTFALEDSPPPRKTRRHGRVEAHA